MIEKQNVPKGNVKFDLNDVAFIEQLCRDAGCYHHKDNSGYVESLQNYDSNIRGEMGVFAYIHKNSDGYYWVATLKDRIDENDSAIYENVEVDWCYWPRLVRDVDGVWFTIDPSDEAKYCEALKALKRLSVWYY